MGKKKKSKEDKWVDDIKEQEQKIFDKEHSFSKKEMKIAKKFMDKPHKAKDDSLAPEDEKIFDPSKVKEFNPEEAFKNAKTVGLEDEGKEEVVFAPEPKKEKYVHLADEEDYVENIEIDTHEFKKGTDGTKPKTSKKGKDKKGKGKKGKKK